MAKTKLTIGEMAALGGRTRAKALSPAERSRSAKNAAVARWEKKKGSLPVAKYGSPDRPLRIGATEIPCYVLEDDRRVLVQRGLQSGIGMSTSGGTRGAHRMARFIESLSAKGLDVHDLAVRIRQPIVFRPSGFGKPAYGYEATILPDICDAVLEAQTQGLLLPQQRHFAAQCGLLVRGLAQVGIIALVDEATGHQDARARDALARILEAFVAKELKKWVRTFPVEYYKELCRLRGVVFPQKQFKLPAYFGHLTNDLVYSRLAPGVLVELRRKNPVVRPGYRRHKHFQWLTEEVGDPKLQQHLWGVVTLMKSCDTWKDFHTRLDRAMPQYSKLPLLAAMEQVEN